VPHDEPDPYRGQFVYFVDEGGVHARDLLPSRTAGGVELTDEYVQELADEAEAGYGVERLRRLQ
jgi:hypothetical protein